MREYFLDWAFDEDEHNNYKFLIECSIHSFKIGDRVKLTVGGRSQHYFGSVTHISSDGIIVHTDTSIDISEYYSIERII